MNLQKLVSTREGHKKVAEMQLADIAEDTCNEELQDILDYVQEKADVIKMLNEKIVAQTDVAEIEAEIIASDGYLFDLTKKIKKQQINYFRATITVQ